jgi:hypothetical protein
MLEAKMEAPITNHPTWRPARKYSVEVFCFRRIDQIAIPSRIRK